MRATARKALARWLREPTVHFLFLGGLLFVVRGVLLAPGGESAARAKRAPVNLSSAQVRELAAGFGEQWGSPPSHAQLAALVEEAVDEALLEREARRLALDLGDRTIRQRLIQKMRAVAADPALGEEELYRAALELGLDDDVVVKRHLRQKMRLLLEQEAHAAPFSDDELASALERHRDRFVQPATVSFSHVFVSAGAHGESLGDRAAALAAEVRSLPRPPAEAAELSDPFPLAPRLDGRSQAVIARHFGADFAAAVMALEPGEWSEPIASPFGLHLVWVHEHSGERLPPLATVRGQIAHIIAQERRLARVRQGLDRLRQLYEIRIEWPEEATADATVAEAGR
jgi:parvulin-like peptidyl-prolyl isomerase